MFNLDMMLRAGIDKCLEDGKFLLAHVRLMLLKDIPPH